MRVSSGPAARLRWPELCRNKQLSSNRNEFTAFTDDPLFIKFEFSSTMVGASTFARNGTNVFSAADAGLDILSPRTSGHATVSKRSVFFHVVHA